MPEQAAVDVVAVATVGQRRDLVEEGQQKGDIVASPPISDTASGTLCPSTPAFGHRRAARTREGLITSRSQSSWFLDRNSFSSSWCSRPQTPASFQAARRRQQVMPEPKPP
ncbi:hypothetical protein B9W64_00060 [Streptomyces sp. CS159]|nr:hypothetical protein B9W64_00060 [Streptomyces sp. CS159]